MNYTPDQKACWDRAMQLLKENLDGPSFNAWFKTLSLYAVTADKLIIVGQNAFSLQHMQSRYGTILLSTIDMVFERKYQLEFYTQEEVAKIRDKLEASTLNEKYTFENFVVGASNSFAYAASLALAEEPSEVYNPLFIYGGVGLGKTHLMNAIGNYITRINPSANVLLMTSETITNELIDAIARKRTAELRNKLRNVDVLMVDDIQFLSRTKATQEEFFHTFNDLHGNKKQIIISSDRPPKEIPEIEERLRSRFEWGLIVNIQKPDFETRVAILKQKADEEGIEVPYEVLEYIARHVSSNIRELEGSLTSLDAHSHLMGTPITLELASNALNHLVKTQEARKVTAELIISVVADKYGVTAEDITGKRRSREIATPRQVAMYICREMTDMSTTSIGRAFGDRDHTTVLHGCDKVADAIAADFAFKRRVEELMKLVEGS
ncbi:MAG: chromosomal replication initiator protein DnaA [Clostridia bacterium]|nr:chromosomal replication initiator protein DnaA [Clostridia bacterium]